MKKLLPLFMLVLCFFALTACGEKLNYEVEVFDDIERGCIEELIVEVKDVSNEGFTVALRNESKFGLYNIAWAHFLLIDIGGVWHELHRAELPFTPRVTIAGEGDPNDPNHIEFTPGSTKEVTITFSSRLGVDTMPSGIYRVGVTYTTLARNNSVPASVSWADFVIE